VRTVVDASVAAKWYFPEAGHAGASGVLAEAIDGRRELLAPDLIVAEFANTLWKKVRRHECSGDDARAILELWEVDRPRLVESAPLAPRALELALQLGRSVYDCLYLAAAIEHEASLVTADADLARAGRRLLAELELIG
jgi:predicted nucleic acid-binding protein